MSKQEQALALGSLMDKWAQCEAIARVAHPGASEEKIYELVAEEMKRRLS